MAEQPSRQRMFEVYELADSVVRTLPEGQLRRAHGLRNVDHSFRASVYGSANMRQRLFLDQGDFDNIGESWLLDDDSRSIAYLNSDTVEDAATIAPFRHRKPYVANPVFFDEHGGQPIFANARNPMVGDSTLAVKETLLKCDESLTALEAHITKPAVKEATVYSGSTSRQITVSTGIRVQDVRNTILGADPNRTDSWRVRIDNAVFASEELIKKVRKEHLVSIAVSLGELLEGSTPRFFGLNWLYYAICRRNSSIGQRFKIRDMILGHLEAPDLLRLQQASRGVEIQMCSKATGRKAGFITDLEQQLWVVGVEEGADPVCRALTPEVMSSSMQMQIFQETMATLNEDKLRFVVKPACMYNKDVFYPPDPDVVKQALSETVDLRFSVPKSQVYHTGSLRLSLVTIPPIFAAEMKASKTELLVTDSTGLRVDHTLLVGPGVEIVRVQDTLLVSKAKWDEIQEKPLKSDELYTWHVRSLEWAMAREEQMQVEVAAGMGAPMPADQAESEDDGASGGVVVQI